MSVKIRLSRIGKKHVPFYRVVAVDSRKKRDGEVLDYLGTYDGLKSKIVVFNDSLYQDWLSKGAIPTDSVKRIYRLSKKVKTEDKESKETKKVLKETVKKETKVEDPSVKEKETVTEKQAAQKDVEHK